MRGYVAVVDRFTTRRHAHASRVMSSMCALVAPYRDAALCSQAMLRLTSITVAAALCRCTASHWEAAAKPV